MVGAANRRPISGSERGVKSLDRYMAIWRGRTTLAVPHADRISPRLTLKWLATSFWMSSILTFFGFGVRHQIANGELGGFYS